ncbi:MAG TPA: discoidin domain-containing protein [Kofleriaceae bacterium]
MVAPSDRPRARLATAIGLAAVVVIYAAVVWRHRWISDDGLIYVRTVRLILHGDGPVFNAAERAEANTSSLWPWLVALASAITRGDPGRVAVGLGGVMAVAGLAISLDATRRWHRARGVTGAIAPAGALCVLGVVPFWDFGTSGLESGLAILWVAVAWAALLGLAGPASPRRLRMTAFAFGLGPLVRPDLAIAAAVMLAAGAWLARPGWRCAAGLAAIAGALPVGYEIFRAGYYATLVPLPALAKSAAGSNWARGGRYLVDFLAPYATWLPLAALAALAAAAILRGAVRRRDAALVVAPVIAGLAIGGFVVRVGGDFMHGRLLLLPMLLVLLPVLAVPWSQRTAPAVAVIAIWLVVELVRLDPRFVPAPGIHQERLEYVGYTRAAHPIDGRAYLAVNLDVAGRAYLAELAGAHRLLSESGNFDLPTRADALAAIAVVTGRLGVGGIIAPLDGFAADTLGLANPLGARIPASAGSFAGHEKLLPLAWLVADVSPVDGATAAATNISLAELSAARHAMTCGALAELLASVRAPMTPARFWQNLTHAAALSRLIVPASPFVAERAFCSAPIDPDLALGAQVTTRSSYQASGWSRDGVADGIRAPAPGALGYCSGLGIRASHEEWIELALPAPVTFSRVVLHPASAAGFPVDFALQVVEGGGWRDVVRRTDYPAPPMAPQVFALAAPVTAARVRLDATRLRALPDGYVVQLAELELLP